MLDSGIAPLDQQLGGMIPGRLHLLTGGPGTGKSTACYHFLQAGLRSGEAVALLTHDRLSDLQSHARCAGLEVRDALRDNKMALLRFRPDFARHLSSSASPYRVMDDLWRTIVDVKPARLVIDPLAPFLNESTASGAVMTALAQLLDGFGVTTLLTYSSDVSAGHDARLNPIVQRASLIAHLARQDDGLHMQIVQNRTGATPVQHARYQLLPESGISTLIVEVVKRAPRTRAAPRTRKRATLEIAKSS